MEHWQHGLGILNALKADEALERGVRGVCSQLAAVLAGAGARVESASDVPLVRELAGLADEVVLVGRAAVARAEARSRDLRDAHRVARIGTWRRDLLDGSLVWSDELHELFGTDPAVFHPTTDAALSMVHPEDRGLIRAAYERVSETGEPAEYEFRVAGPDGALHWRFTELRAELGEGGAVVGLRAVVQDVTERKRALEHIHHLAHYDALTGLANRAHLAERLQEFLGRARRKEQGLAVLALDLDGFKAVNDVHGHGAGDRLLQIVARRLTGSVREGDLVARLGGDEFVIVMAELEEPEGARRLAERLVGALSQPCDVQQPGREGGEVEVSVTVSVGIALFPEDVGGGDAGAELLAAADTALYRVKRGGRNGHAFFKPALDGQQRERRALEQDLRLALSRGELAVAYQPQADAGTGEVLGFEALLRWVHPERGTVSPGVFIPVAEATGCILPIGEWVLREACREAAGWAVPLRVAVNVSALQVQQGDLPELVRSALEESGLDPARLELEVTESVLLSDLGGSGEGTDRVVAALHQVRALGVRLAMDDFGTGYSSLASLRAFPFDKIKLDRGFVADLGRSADADAIVRAVLGLGRGMKLPVVAEGVETAGQAAALRLEGCDELQGYLIGRPLPIASYVDLTSARLGAGLGAAVGLSLETVVTG